MIKIPKEALERYLSENLFRVYDLSPQLRVKHDIEAEKKRNGY